MRSFRIRATALSTLGISPKSAPLSQAGALVMPLHGTCRSVCLGLICSLTLGSCYILRKANETSGLPGDLSDHTHLSSTELCSCTVYSCSSKEELPLCLFSWQNRENLSQLPFWNKNQQAFCAKGQIGNISGFVGYSVSVTLSSCRTKEP